LNKSLYQQYKTIQDSYITQILEAVDGDPLWDFISKIYDDLGTIATTEESDEEILKKIELQDFRKATPSFFKCLKTTVLMINFK